jgi:drug/metabolite transporter (DMT)-like permease
MADSVTGRHDREPGEHIAGRVIGILVFLGGIAMLVLAFVLAYNAFNRPDMIIPADALKHTPAPNPTVVYLTMALRLILLFVMGYIGSLIAARGAQLFFSARRELRSVAGD